MSLRPGSLDALRQQRPEWSPWLAVVDEVLRETASGRWDRMVPEAPARGAPLLDGAAIAVDQRAVTHLLERLFRTAARGNTPAMATLRPAQAEVADPAALFEAAILQDGGRIAAAASGTSADPDAFQAVVALLPIPFLQACARRWRSAISPGWSEGHCPVCVSWPAFTEVRGIERSRFLRCGRCGAEWFAELLRCAYCNTRDHDELTTLVSETNGSTSAIDACRRCRGYVKAFTRLQGCSPERVMLEDLGSVDLDVAALEQGYARPSGAARALDVAVRAAATTPRFFAWNASRT